MRTSRSYAEPLESIRAEMAARALCALARETRTIEFDSEVPEIVAWLARPRTSDELGKV